MSKSRGQASITVAEAALGILLVMSTTFVFALGVSDGEETLTQTQLDTYAQDATTLLTNESPRHTDQTRLSELTASESSFEREKGEFERRVERILPPNLMFRVETKHGVAGHPLPADTPTGETTVLTTNGDVTLRVWYV